jgi:hypothetical protein
MDFMRTGDSLSLTERKNFHVNSGHFSQQKEDYTHNFHNSSKERTSHSDRSSALTAVSISINLAFSGFQGLANPLSCLTHNYSNWQNMSLQKKRLTLGCHAMKVGGAAINCWGYGKVLGAIAKTANTAYTIYQITRQGATNGRMDQTAQKVSQFVDSFFAEIGHTSNVQQLADLINQWLGNGTKMIKNKAGDPVFLSKDGLKRIRYDFQRPKPHNNPHMHVDEFIRGDWEKSGQIYPIDVPHN